jgi:hypothetical protein
MRAISLAVPRRSIEFSHELRLEAALCIFPTALEILLAVVSQHLILPPAQSKYVWLTPVSIPGRAYRIRFLGHRIHLIDRDLQSAVTSGFAGLVKTDVAVADLNKAAGRVRS